MNRLGKKDQEFEIMSEIKIVNLDGKMPLSEAIEKLEKIRKQVESLTTVSYRSKLNDFIQINNTVKELAY